jgi:transglutaminase-like putative cysteine protease
VRTPPGLVGAALLFWGWQTGLLAVAAVLALGLEASRVISLRWDLSAEDQNRVADLSTVLFLGLAVYLVVTVGFTRAAMLTLEWLPLSLLPLLTVQAYGSAGAVSITALFWSRRKGRAKENASGPRTVELSYAYFALCVLSAGTVTARTPAFYAGVCALGAWALWSTRGPAFSRGTWIAALAMVAALGWAGHVALHELQKVVERVTTELFGDARPPDTDPYRSHTSIGRIGSLKLSERVLLRVDPGPGVTPPILLRDASYDVLGGRTWLAVGAEFAPVEPSVERTTWTLDRGRAATRRVTVSASLAHGKGVIALPVGAVTIEGLSAGALKRNRLGAVRVDEAPGTITYAVQFDPSSSIDAPPTESDLTLPKSETPIVTALAAELNLAARPPGEAITLVGTLFRERFTYSTFLAQGDEGSTPLGHFLRRTKSGHCEYFATAAVLLLRAAGIPARYATGYSVQEWSRLEGRYIVRARHAHAWAIAWVDGAWHDVDATPPRWITAEGAEAPIWEPAADLWAWVSFRVSGWWDRVDLAQLTRYLGWLLIPLVAWLVWRLRLRHGARRVAGTASPVEATAARRGEDSEFYAIERALAARGLGRRPEEPVVRWLARIEGADPRLSRLRSAAALHSRYRFDPAGLERAERERLRSEVERCLGSDLGLHAVTRTTARRF